MRPAPCSTPPCPRDGSWSKRDEHDVAEALLASCSAQWIWGRFYAGSSSSSDFGLK
jgi:hypothetical protein